MATVRAECLKGALDLRGTVGFLATIKIGYSKIRICQGWLTFPSHDDQLSKPSVELRPNPFL